MLKTYYKPFLNGFWRFFRGRRMIFGKKVDVEIGREDRYVEEVKSEGMDACSDSVSFLASGGTGSLRANVGIW